ncbi:MAG: ABC transporter substrate-binding protein [Bosea sp. (in: a-proteobacteria)]
MTSIRFGALTRRTALAATAAAALLPRAAQAQAKSLTIALTADAIILDPHAANELSANIMFYHFYDALVQRTPELEFKPSLAESWQVVDDTTWVFKLRRGVKFHNGDELKAADVVFTVERLKKALMASLVANISTARAIDDYTVEFKTPKPYAVLHMALAEILIMSEKHTTGRAPEEIGLKPMGTGPYRLVEWIKEDRLVMEAHPDHWRGKAKVERVTFKPITNPATRTAALLTGGVDVIQDLSVRDVASVRANNAFNVITRPSLLNIVLALDLRDKSPTIDLPVNPMKDRRVREAIVRAINVEGLRTAVMNGFSTPSEQYVPSSHLGYVPGTSFRQLYPFDLVKAAALMKEAGFEKGFTMTLDTTNNRYVNDATIAQALASMLSRINITVNLNLMPRANFFGYIRVPSDKSSFIMSGWDTPSGDAGNMYNVLLYSRGRKTGYGQANRGAYSNTAFDEAIDKADATSDMKKRHEFLQEATKIAVQDIPMIPVHYEQDIYAAKKNVTVVPRMDKFIWAYEMDVA